MLLRLMRVAEGWTWGQYYNGLISGKSGENGYFDKKFSYLDRNVILTFVKKYPHL
jgi:hypothetical protein